ncbi:MAG: hypothetical protein HC869_06745, partial [Rhodospirillales bacterium]|nr:hypothetical protein [Rhodospirillales bacterium]
MMEIMMAVFESAAYGRRVDLPQTQRDESANKHEEEQMLQAELKPVWRQSPMASVDSAQIFRAAAGAHS